MIDYRIEYETYDGRPAIYSIRAIDETEAQFKFLERNPDVSAIISVTPQFKNDYPRTDRPIIQVRI